MPLFPQTGGILPPSQMPNQQMPGQPANGGGIFPNAAGTAAPFEGRDYNQMLGGSLDYFMNPNSSLVQGARQRGVDYANERGGINSSIAAGASERAALEQAVPLAQTAVGTQIGQEQAKLNDWMDSQQFGRDLAAKPFENSMGMLSSVTAASLRDPDLFTPSVVSGYTNFFNKNMADMMKQYFGGQGA